MIKPDTLHIEHEDLERETALRYLPHFQADTKEPFPIEGIGYTIYKGGTHKSDSCRRVYHIDENRCKYMIEYAVFYDFDIQHLYDLEHVFVYVGLKDEVIDVEASFHGKFLKSMINGVLTIEDETHPVIYMQPGKHAMMPIPEYFNLFIGLKEACMEDAGVDGFLIAPMFEGRLETSSEIDEKVKEYICKHYTFAPSFQYVPMMVWPEKVMPYQKLEDVIVEHMKTWLAKIISEL